MGRVEKSSLVCISIILIFSIYVFVTPIFTLFQGPREEDLVINFYGSIEAAYAALKAGDIDAVGYEIPSNLYADAINDSNIVLAPVGDRGMYELDINNNYTVDYAGIRSPTNYQGFRQAITYLVDKDYITETVCGGFANRIDQPMAYIHRGWRNQSYWYEDGTYPYEYNPVAAVAILDTVGFTQGSEPNPDYNPTFPGSAEFLRTYPPDHPQKPGQTLDNLNFFVRTDDRRRHQAGLLLCENLRLLGIPINLIENWIWFPPSWEEMHIYTGGWSLGRFPGITAYWLFHSSNYGIDQSNLWTGVDENGDPNFPLLDDLLEVARFPANYSEAVSATKKAMGYIVEQCISIPLFSARSYWAWNSELLGVVNGEGVGVGLENAYTFLNAYKTDGSPIRYGLKTPPGEMNKIYSSWYYDYQCLDRMDLYGGIDVPPYDASINQAGYIFDWETTTWNDNGTTKTLTQQTYCDDAWFVEPVTGNQLERVNSTHHYASIWYEYQLSDAWNNDGVIDIQFVYPTGPHSYHIYWDTYDYWNTHLGATSIKSFNWWSKGTLSQTVTDTNLVPDDDGFIGCTQPVFYVLNITGDGTPLTLGTGYNIYKDDDGPNNADVKVFGAYTDVDITYLATNDAYGYYPGGLPWQDAWEGAGMYYATDFSPGGGGYLNLKANPFYPTESPRIGEVDFVKKPNGCFKVDIYDVVIVASAYGSQGVGIPDEHWFAGADLASSGGQIDIFDVVTVASSYGEEWDCYP